MIGKDTRNIAFFSIGESYTTLNYQYLHFDYNT